MTCGAVLPLMEWSESLRCTTSNASLRYVENFDRF